MINKKVQFNFPENIPKRCLMFTLCPNCIKPTLKYYCCLLNSFGSAQRSSGTPSDISGNVQKSLKNCQRSSEAACWDVLWNPSHDKKDTEGSLMPLTQKKVADKVLPLVLWGNIVRCSPCKLSSLQVQILSSHYWGPYPEKSNTLEWFSMINYWLMKKTFADCLT